MKYINSGYDEEKGVYYIVTDLWGKDLSQLIHECDSKLFSLESTILIALIMLKRIKNLH